MKKLLILAVLALAGTAHAADQLVDTDKHELPTHRLQFSDTLDVVQDPKNNVVCYVARQSDSHAMQLQCLKVK
ncbi:hypothetical protein [Caballeronia sp. LZ032]|uniref:hypothetical protein n=1 Tax=Caballeronia sp. LZ032 TaxID=3038565 RepID=UPI00285F9B5A|nr:hypothetical protein [Caballeronia sp. LZ032]MDR5879042.1 hypothetical protein [Caballeronia sp. LZ032]